MNKRQTIVTGVVCFIFAFVGFAFGTEYSGAWFYFFGILCPVLILGAYLVFLFRDRAPSMQGAPPDREFGYMALVATPLLLFLLALVLM